ncbi:hypothetical protein ADIAG_01272 [Paeniglutamicibacter gangotriensis Lz1y]|uniref:Uncharacterized protein n=1 Tax=Paeniglutamicibacter gangotriensis Lz1y TaxID=1276920 RepID=M7NBW9_9MICC|nr:hypothetical protein ADIAG_01272 [Paeniglutamicibacter gangotriensis Lz1y]
MCRTITCRKCRKTTWAGCGQHVKQVMANVPHGERCSCDPNVPKKARKGGGFLARLLGR